MTFIVFAEKRCTSPTIPPNGRVVGGVIFSHYDVGKTVSFLCAPGYQLEGAATVTCTSDETWSHAEPTCTGAECNLSVSGNSVAHIFASFAIWAFSRVQLTAIFLLFMLLLLLLQLLFFCADFDECADPANSPCGPNASCNNAVGTFTCTCNSGYRSIGKTCECKPFLQFFESVAAVHRAGNTRKVSLGAHIGYFSEKIRKPFRKTHIRWDSASKALYQFAFFCVGINYFCCGGGRWYLVRGG